MEAGEHLWSNWHRGERNQNPPVDQPGRLALRMMIDPTGDNTLYGKLYLGDLDDLERQLNWEDDWRGHDWVISCCYEKANHYHDIVERIGIADIIQTWLPTNDNAQDDIIKTFCKAFGKRAQAVRDFLRQRGNVLVLCWGGCNRSAALCVFILLGMGYQLDEAFQEVKQARGCVLTNQTFIARLAWHAAKLKAETTRLPPSPPSGPTTSWTSNRDPGNCLEAWSPWR